MFDWKVEDMVLYNQKGVIYIGNEEIYNCESKVSREDKIAFVDEFQNGKLSYILSLIEKYNAEEDKLPKDTWGNVKTVSLKAWIKRNDKDERFKPFGVFDSNGKIRIYTIQRYITYNHKGTYDTYEDLVDECFHRQLKECEQKEKEYFLEHDEYSILKKRFMDYSSYGTTFGIKIGFWSDGRICVENEDSTQEREITIDEIKELIAKYEQIDRLVEKLTEETHIVY